MTSILIHEIEYPTGGSIERTLSDRVSGLSQTKGVDYKESYVLDKLQTCYLTYFSNGD